MVAVRRALVACAWPAEILVGVVFLAGAVLKASDIDLFTVQIKYYGVIASPSYLSTAALGTLAIEMLLGAALVLGCRLRGLTFLAVLALLAVFTGLIGYGWAFHDLKNCGCFGRLEMSPGISILKNVALATLCGAAWSGFIMRPKRPLRAPLYVAKLLVCVVAAFGIVFNAHAHMEKVEVSPRPFAQFVFDLDGTPWDLGSGEYFVAMLDMTCEHCMAAIESINDLTYIPDFPPLIALCLEWNEGDLEEFRQLTQPVFPLYSLGNRMRTFYSLVGDAAPRFYYIRDGREVKHWDATVPDPTEVLEAQALPLP